MGGCMSNTRVDNITSEPVQQQRAPGGRAFNAESEHQTASNTHYRCSKRTSEVPGKGEAARLRRGASPQPVLVYSTASEVSATSSTSHACVRRSRSALVQRVSSDSKSGIWTFYRKIRTIASGGYGSVLEVESILSHQRYAVKVMDKSNYNVKSSSFDFENEVQCLQNLAGSPFVVRIKGAYESEHHLYLIMELCPDGDLLQLLRDHGPQPVDVAREIARQLALGVNHMHNHGVIHRDLKPENVLVSQSSGKVRIKICDFGLSKLISSIAPTKIGTKLYAAPEVLLGTRDTGPEADMWAVGLILFMIIGGYHPFDEFAEYKERNVMSRMVKGDFNFKDDAWLSVSTVAKDAIRHCLDTSPFTRWTAKDLLESAWLQSSKVLRLPVRNSVADDTVGNDTTSVSDSNLDDDCAEIDSVLADLMCMDKLKARQSSSKAKVPALKAFEDIQEPSSLETSPLDAAPVSAAGSNMLALDSLLGSRAQVIVARPREQATLPGAVTPSDDTASFSAPTSAVPSKIRSRRASAVFHNEVGEAWCSMTPKPVTRRTRRSDRVHWRRKVLHVGTTSHHPFATPGNSPTVRAVRVRTEAVLMQSVERKRHRGSRFSSSCHCTSSMPSSMTADDIAAVDYDEVKLTQVLSSLPKSRSAPDLCRAANANNDRPSALLAMMRGLDNETCENVPATPATHTAVCAKLSAHAPEQANSPTQSASQASSDSHVDSPFLCLVVEDASVTSDLHIRSPWKRRSLSRQSGNNNRNMMPGTPPMQPLGRTARHARRRMRAINAAQQVSGTVPSSRKQ